MGFFGKIRSAVAGAALGFRMSVGAYSEATNWSADRSNVMYIAPSDTRQALPRWTRQQINAKVDWLFQNFGVVKEGVRGITRHTVGTGRTLQLNSDDSDWNDLAELDWESYALSKDRCDVACRRNFYDFQNLAVEQRMKRNAFFAAFCQNPRWTTKKPDGTTLVDNDGDPLGDPCLMAFDDSEIVTPNGKGPENRIFDGIELDEDNAPTFYHAKVAGGKTQAIPATEMIHWYKPDEINAVRNVSEFATSIARLVDIHDLIKVTTRSGKTHGAMALFIKKAAKIGGQGALGAIRKGLGPQPTPSAPPAPGQPTQGVEQAGGQPLEHVFGGGAIMYYGDDGDVKVVQSTQPSPLVEQFIADLLMRDALKSWGIDSDFFWSMSKLNGTNIRLVMLKAGLLFSVLGDGLDYEVCKPWAVRFLEHRMATGQLRQCTDPNWMHKLSFQGPADMSIDEGRTGNLELAQLAAGVVNMQILDNRRGRNTRPKIRQWFREWAWAAKAAADEKVPWALKFWRAGMPGSTAPGAQQPEPGADKPEPDGGEDDDNTTGGDDKPPGGKDE